jgi:hypothetical protein
MFFAVNSNCRHSDIKIDHNGVQIDCCCARHDLKLRASSNLNVPELFADTMAQRMIRFLVQTIITTRRMASRETQLFGTARSSSSKCQTLSGGMTLADPPCTQLLPVMVYPVLPSVLSLMSPMVRPEKLVQPVLEPPLIPSSVWNKALRGGALTHSALFPGSNTLSTKSSRGCRNVPWSSPTLMDSIAGFRLTIAFFAQGLGEVYSPADELVRSLAGCVQAHRGQ